jgi:translocation and assembly module TamA
MVLLKKRAMMTGQRRIFLLVLGLLVSWSWHVCAAESDVASSDTNASAEDTAALGGSSPSDNTPQTEDTPSLAAPSASDNTPPTEDTPALADSSPSYNTTPAEDTSALATPPAPNPKRNDTVLIGSEGFKLVIFGVEDEKLQKMITQNSLLFKRLGRHPETLSDLKQLAAEDLENMRRFLATLGYHNPELDFFVDTRKKPFIVYVKVKLPVFGRRIPALKTDDSTLVGPVGFKLVIFGVEDAGLEKVLKHNSLLFKRQDNPPETVLALKQLAVDDLGNMQRVLATQGYYDAEFDYFVDTRKKPFDVYVKIRLGTLYTIGAFKLKSDTPGNMQMSILEDSIESLGITLGQPGKAEYFREASEKALDHLQKYGYPFARLKPGGDRIVVDRVAKTIQGAFLISPGPLARFGKVQMDNVAGVSPEFLKERLQWKEGDIYNEQKVLDTIESLYNTRLFKNIKIIHEDALDPKTGLLNMYIRADSSPKNSIQGNLLYASNRKNDARILWEKRNFRGMGEILRLGAAMGTYRKLFEGSFIQPDMFMLNLEMASRLTAGVNSTPAYNTKGVEVASTFQYPFMRLLVGSAGLGLDMQRAGAKTGGQKPYRYLTAPLQLSYQTTGLNNFLKKGYQATVKMTPQLRVFSDKAQFFDSMQINQRAYMPVAMDGKLALEPWVNVGMIPGAGHHVVPVHKRFYVGGADSVRGYSYQMAGPLDNQGNPIGGLSSFAFGSELKYYLSEKLSMLSFVDVGTVFRNSLPDFSTQFMCGVGVGLRYETPIGTLRIDIGSPLRRRDQDDAVQAYIGLDKKL